MITVRTWIYQDNCGRLFFLEFVEPSTSTTVTPHALTIMTPAEVENTRG